MRFNLAIYYVTIALSLMAIALVVIGIIEWDTVWLWSGAGLAAANAALGFWNSARLTRPAQHQRKDNA